MSNYLLYLISTLLTAILVTNDVIAQTDLKPEEVMAREDQIPEDEKMIFEGLKEHTDLCTRVYNHSRPEFILKFLETGELENENDRQAKCFFTCMLQMAGVADAKEGSYDPRQATILFAPPNSKMQLDVHVMTEECSNNQVEEDMCDKAYHFMQCVMKKVLRKFQPPPRLITPTVATTTTEIAFIEYH